ncbi:hypothetical protein GUJ93_ZPchr0010g9713 [Zizania palustris]|uniref:Peptidase A1 domain-containing protein n=1 Tax=Zizania palustris TaxID=103762 RepID=A0A8J5W197_ZIZPA|nr:hypothetical protein GUJ93_ZPchr0010g9713 [Zizania palustris]
MGKAVAAALLVLCLISTCSLSTRAAAFGAHDLRRGLERALRGDHLADATAGGAAVPIHRSHGVYFVNYTIGTPPQSVSAIMDVNGELIWTQCAACNRSRCFEQELPLFDSSASSTFRAEPCGTTLCETVPTRNCSSNVCIYEASTNAGETGGIVATDTLAVGTIKANLGFGCVVASDIDTVWGTSGFVGLARTPWSLVGQMNATAFSYCLAPPGAGKNSALFIGDSAKLTGINSTSTPLVNASAPPDDALSQYYAVRLEGIKAGGTEITPPTSGSTVLIHTFLPVTFLVDSAYQVLKKAVMAQIGVAPTAKPLLGYDLCFPKAGASSAPDLVFTFHGTAAMTVPPSNYLLEDGNGTVCLTIWSSARLNSTAADTVNILGSIQQENIHFLFDLEKETLSFEPADCSALS